MTATFFKFTCASAFSAVLLTACGGGGGGSGDGVPSNVGGGDTVSTLTFNPRASYENRLQNHVSDDFNVDYRSPQFNCIGTGNITLDPAPQDTFEGVPSFVISQVGTISCNNGTSMASGKTYYAVSNFGEVGFIQDKSTNGAIEYDVLLDSLLSQPPTLPTAVKVGDPPGDLGSYKVYEDRTKTRQLGTRKITWAIERDTAQTAMLNITNQSFDMSGKVQVEQQSRYRMSGGTLMYWSNDVNDFSTNTRIFYTNTKQ